MVVNHIHDYPKALFVEGLNHHFELTGPGISVVWIGRIPSLRRIEVERIITPVVLRVGFGFIYGIEIGNGQQMDMCYSQLLQVVNSRG